LSAAGSKGRRSPLELLHPDGIARTSLVLGDACPPGLEPIGTEADAVDLVVVAGAELGPALQTAATRLAQDGILYVAAPPRRAAKAIQTCGLVPGPALLTLRGTGSRRLLVPAQAAQYALDQLVPAAGWRGRAARLAVRGGGARLLPHLAPSGIVARRPGARPLHDWLRTVGGVDAPSAILSWGDGSSLVVHAHGVVVKVGGRGTEADTLRELGPAAREAGARVPEPIRTGTVAGLPLLVETSLPGRPASAHLTPSRFPAFLSELTGWLQRWNVATAAPRPLGRPELDRAILAPLHALQLGDERRRRLEELCARAEGKVVPLVAAHHDLTTANVLVGESLGIVDWDAAEAAALPLTDFFYAAADARAAADGFRDRVGAFARTFAADGTPAPDVEPLQARLVAALGLDPHVVRLSFHACWLRHAANELAQSGPGPFGEIARRVAAAS
jgi:hypothetical protein